MSFSVGGNSRRQFMACIAKHIAQLRSNGLGFALELLLPVVFVGVTVVLWATFGVAKGDATHFVRYDNEALAFVKGSLFHALEDNICVNSSSSPFGVSSIRPCAAVPYAFSCFKDSPHIPQSITLCQNSNSTQFRAAQLIQQIATAGITGFSGPIPFDDLVLLHWVAGSVFDQHLQNRDFFTSLAAFNSGGKLHFAPNTSATRLLIDHFNHSTALFRHVFGRLFETEEDAENYAFLSDAGQLARDGATWGIIVVNSLSSTGGKFDVTIRLNHTAMPKTTYLVNPLYAGGPNGDNVLYLLNGFATLQSMISRYFLIGNQQQQQVIPSHVVFVPMGFQAYDAQAFLVFGGTLTPLIILLGFLYPVSQVAKRIVLEKELHIREAMFVMGLTKFPLYASWIAVQAVVTVASSVACTVILKQTFLARSDPIALFFSFWLFELSLISFAGMLSSFFTSSRVAATVSPVIFFLTAAPIYAMGGSNVALKASLLFLSPTAFSEALLQFFQREIVGGLGASDVTSDADPPNVLTILLVLAADALLYCLMWVYLDQVLPTSGSGDDCSRPWHFPLSDFFAPSDTPQQQPVLSPNAPPTLEPPSLSRFEKRMDGMAPPSVHIRNLSKTFAVRGGGSSGEKPRKAVDGVSFNLYEGEISVLLGHNGAGKSTTVSMLTGRLQPDAGDCVIYGHSIRNDMASVRGLIGFCPQHNILWSELSCDEHLRFFGAIKGVQGDVIDEEIEHVLQNVGLASKRFAAAGTLSGGQKRKLSLAIAFIGDSKLIILDEPTAGMDVTARRLTWDLLRSQSETRTILLTTHYMDEADLLGDCVSILLRGKLFCSGSSTFLKTHLDVGYTMHISYWAESAVNELKKVVWSVVPQAEAVSAGAGILTMQLPSGSLPLFPQLLKKFESDKKVTNLLGDGGFSISAPTLEDVFHRVDLEGIKTEGADEEVPLSRAGSITETLSTMWESETLEPHSSSLFASQVSACIIKKRLRYALRDRRSQCFQIAIPVVAIIVAMSLSLIQFVSVPSIVLTSDAYGEPVDILLTARCSDTIRTNSARVGSWATLVTIPSFSITTSSNSSSSLGLSTLLMNEANRHGFAGRYSALSCNDTQLAASLSPTTHFNSNNNSYDVLFYNFSAPHSIIIALADYYNALHTRSSFSTGNTTEPMRIVNNPMPLTRNEGAYWDSIRSITIAVIIMIPFTFIPSTFVSWAVQERACGARHLQTIAGCPISFSTGHHIS